MKVSIVMPVYQVSAYVERCLSSVMRQSFTDIECILVDDRTKDDSVEKCERLIQAYHGDMVFSILRHETNRGLSVARNTGTDAATGEYLFYLDSDDEITDDCIGKLVDAVQEHPDAEMVVGNTQVFNDGIPTRIWIREETPCLIQGNETIASFYHKRLIPNAAWNKLIKRTFIKEHGLYFKEGIIHEDILWMFYVMKYLTQVVLVKDVTSHYLLRSGSISTGSNDEVEGKNYLAVYDDMVHHLTPGREDKELKRYVNHFCRCYLSYKSLFPGYKKLYGLYLKKAFRHHSWYSSLALVPVGVMGLFGNPNRVFEPLNSIRGRLMRFLKGKDRH